MGTTMKYDITPIFTSLFMLMYAYLWKMANRHGCSDFYVFV